jgi:hypothetical protein
MKSNEIVRSRKPRSQPISGLDRFFQAVMDRRIADAEKELDSVRAAIPATESTKGNLKACEGLLLTTKANSDKYLYLSKIERTQKQLKTLRKEFAAQTKHVLHTDYDRGFFQVLESYMKKLEQARTRSENQVDESRPNENKH